LPFVGDIALKSLGSRNMCVAMGGEGWNELVGGESTHANGFFFFCAMKPVRMALHCCVWVVCLLEILHEYLAKG
jgi:hypothetical protein